MNADSQGRVKCNNPRVFSEQTCVLAGAPRAGDGWMAQSRHMPRVKRDGGSLILANYESYLWKLKSVSNDTEAVLRRN